MHLNNGHMYPTQLAQIFGFWRTTVKPFNLAALNFSVLPSVDILAALKFSVFIV